MTPVSEIEVRDSVDHLFRHHAGRMVAVLCRIFGFEHIDAIEDAVQDALIAALRKWPFTGMPENPTAWLTTTARNRVIDHLRRGYRLERAGEDFDIAAPPEHDRVFFPNEIDEDQLRMIFACCHPSVPPDGQVALTLKIVGGFSVPEIASAYLASEDSVAKMITRAKARLRDRRVPLDIPVAGEIGERLDAVLKVLYLMFNEGYSASGGNDLVRHDLCFEAIRLVEFLARHPATASPKVHAAAALFLFQASRLSARTDHAGELVLLADQDRSAWDGRLIARGIDHFRRSASGENISALHLEAEIAAIHTLSPDYASTDWKRILECYTLLQNISFSPVAELNRIIALARTETSQTAIIELERLNGAREMNNYNLFHVTRGQLLCELDRPLEAANAFENALKLTKNEAVRRFICGKLHAISHRHR